MRKPSKAVAILKWKLKRGKEPTLENLLAVLDDTRRLIIPPEFRRPPRDPSRLPPAATVEDFEENVFRAAVEDFQAEARAVRDANRQLLSDIVLDGYYRAEEAAARDPENADLVSMVKELRRILEQAYGGRIPERPL